MRTRPGFARLLPLMALTGLAAGTIALLASARPVQAPARADEPMVSVLCGGDDDPCSDVPAPVPANGIVDAEGRRYELSDIPDGTLRGLDLRNSKWAGVDLHNAKFVDCDLRGVDLRGADLRDVTFNGCQLEGASLEGANLGHFVIFNDCRVRGARAQGRGLGDIAPHRQEWNSFVLLGDNRSSRSSSLRGHTPVR